MQLLKFSIFITLIFSFNSSYSSDLGEETGNQYFLTFVGAFNALGEHEERTEVWKGVINNLAKIFRGEPVSESEEMSTEVRFNFVGGWNAGKAIEKAQNKAVRDKEGQIPAGATAQANDCQLTATQRILYQIPGTELSHDIVLAAGASEDCNLNKAKESVMQQMGEDVAEAFANGFFTTIEGFEKYELVTFAKQKINGTWE